MSDLSLAQRLEAFSQSPARSYHMPGHKRRALHSPTLPWALDITEIHGFDDLHDPQGVLAESMARAAALWGAKRSWYLVNGSSGGILAALQAALPRGSSLLVARNCHKSIYHGLELLDLTPIYLQPDPDPAFGVAGPLSVEQAAAALDAHPEARALMLPCPTYDGVLCDLPALCALCHSRGVAVLVDAAHGAHLGFGPFPASAVAAGADVVVQSLHKTLPSLTQTAILHWQGDLVDPRRLARSLNVFQSSSPSYPLMAAMDGCTRLLEQTGDKLFEDWMAAIRAFDEAILGLKHLKVLCHGADVLDNHPGFYGCDPSKMVISTRGTGLTGPALMERLREEFGLVLEMAATDYVTAMTGLGTDAEDLSALAEALLAVDAGLTAEEVPPAPAAPAVPRRVLPAGEALDCPTEVLPLEAATGRVAAEYLWAYPPGIPLLVPGEEIGPGFPALCARYADSGIALKHTGGAPQGSILVCR